MIKPLRRGSVLGSKHFDLEVNNQDFAFSNQFAVQGFNKSYTIGLISDGCTGMPAFSHTEVGSSLICLYAFRRIQEYVCSGDVTLDTVPLVLYGGLTEFLGQLSHMVMPRHIYWPHPKGIKYSDGRGDWTADQRFRNECLAGTLLGFVSNGEELITFSAGDGIILINDELTVIDQNDQPEYMIYSVNRPGNGFETQSYALSDIERISVMSDGLQSLVQSEEDPTKPTEFVDEMFSYLPTSEFGLQIFLKLKKDEYWGTKKHMTDDCSAVTFTPPQKEGDS